MRDIILFVLTLISVIVTIIDTLYRLIRKCIMGDEPGIVIRPAEIQTVNRRPSLDSLTGIDIAVRSGTPPRSIITRSLSSTQNNS